jgi:hypothetical protein
MSKRAIIAAVVGTIVYMVLNIGHGLLLANMYMSYADLWRPPEEFRLWLVLLGAAVQVFVFTAIYERFIPDKSMSRALVYGVLWGLVIGLNAAGGYATLPVAPAVGWAWVLSGLFPTVIIGAIVGALVKPQPASPA